MTKIRPSLHGLSYRLTENLMSVNDITHSDNVFSGIFHG